MNTSDSPINTQTIKACFNPLIRPYLVVTIGFTLFMTIIGIPLAIIWFLGVGQWWARHYFDKLECELGEKSLRYRKGILVQVEKTIPLENIQDVTFIEGPILKHFQLSTLKFETATAFDTGCRSASRRCMICWRKSWALIMPVSCMALAWP